MSSRIASKRKQDENALIPTWWKVSDGTATSQIMTQNADPTSNEEADFAGFVVSFNAKHHLRSDPPSTELLAHCDVSDGSLVSILFLACVGREMLS
jgi:hypothetical protein